MKSRLAPILLFALALGLRTAYILEIDDSPTFTHPPVDGVTYVKQAEAIAAGNWLGRGQEPFWQPPLYPYLLGLFRLFFGGDAFFYAVRLFQALAGAGTCLLAWHLGSRLFHPGVGLAAGAAAAVYGPLIYFDGEILPASLATFLDLAGLALLLRCLRMPTFPGFLGAGALFGLASLTVPTVLSFAAAAAVFVWVKLKRGAPLSAPRLAFPAAFLLGVLLPILPVAVRNAAIGGDAVLISYNAGVNFYVGNNENYDESVGIRPGWDWDELLDRPQKEAGITRPSGRSAFFFSQSWDFISSRPADYLGLLTRKLYLFWHGDEIGRNQGIYFWRNYSDILSIALWKQVIAFPFGIVAPLALAGALLAFRRNGASLPLLFIALYSISVIAFFVTSRYRLPVVPLLLIYAAHAGHCLVAGLRGGNRRPAAFLALCLSLLLPAANFRVGAMDLDGDAAIRFNLGVAHMLERDAPAARREFELAVARDPTHWQAWFNLGTISAIERDPEGAIPIYERVLEAHPDRVVAWVSLARARRQVGDREGARQAYEAGLSADPVAFNYYGRYAELIEFCMQMGDRSCAERVLGIARRHSPDEIRRLRRLLP